MPSYADLILASGAWIWLLFAFAFGACAGSLINVLVYRLPLGMSVVTPASRCPACSTKLTWRENIPVLGWVFLRGRCRFCRSRISPEYPMVEALVGLLFALFFFLWYVMPQPAFWLDADWSQIRPEWAAFDALFDHWPRQSWPMFIVLITLVASLVAMSLVDLKTYTIPLQIPWFATIVGVLFHVGYGIYRSVSGTSLRYTGMPRHLWSMPVPDATGWWWLGATLGACAGLVIANIMLAKGWIRRSFADYADWEREHLAATRPADPAAASGVGAIEQHLAVPEEGPLGRMFPWFARFRRFLLVMLLFAAAATVLGALTGGAIGVPRWSGLLVGVLIGPMIAAVAIRPLFSSASPSAMSEGDGAAGAPAEGAPADTWIQYPHARREMLKEVLFLTPALGLAWVGGEIAARAGAGHLMPLWCSVLAGVLMGYLIGGGVVWAFRIIGSLGFAKEALGLGDVHLMAAVGACIGWIDASLAFPLAAMVGLYWVIVHALATRQMPRAMQFGPYLALATLLVVLGKPLIELGLTRLLRIEPPNLPIDLP